MPGTGRHRIVRLPRRCTKLASIPAIVLAIAASRVGADEVPSPGKLFPVPSASRVVGTEWKIKAAQETASRAGAAASVPAFSMKRRGVFGLFSFARSFFLNAP